MVTGISGFHRKNGIQILASALPFHSGEASVIHQVCVLGETAIFPFSADEHAQRLHMSTDRAGAVFQDLLFSDKKATAGRKTFEYALQQQANLRLGPVVQNPAQRVKVGARKFVEKEVARLKSNSLMSRGFRYELARHRDHLL